MVILNNLACLCVTYYPLYAVAHYMKYPRFETRITWSAVSPLPVHCHKTAILGSDKSLMLPPDKLYLCFSSTTCGQDTNIIVARHNMLRQLFLIW